MQGAYNQFKDTEEWRKQNEIETLYKNIDVESFGEARAMVRKPNIFDLTDPKRAKVIMNPLTNSSSSIPNGLVAAIVVASPSMFSLSNI